MAMLFVANSLSSFTSIQRAEEEKYIASGVVFLSFMVIQGHRSWYQSKVHMRLPISLPL